jgi:Protein of unknown function (DUF4446)
VVPSAALRGAAAPRGVGGAAGIARPSLARMTTYVAVFALILAYLALVAAYGALRTLARLRRATTVLARGADSRESILEAAERHIELTTVVAGRLADLQAEMAAIKAEALAVVRSGQAAVDEHLTVVQADAARALRNTALVRFDAFDDMAGRMSFALALLDDRGDGVTLSAIAGRSDTRLYAKGVSAGAGEHDLSPEEKQAVKAALGQRPQGARPVLAPAMVELGRKAG